MRPLTILIRLRGTVAVLSQLGWLHASFACHSLAYCYIIVIVITRRKIPFVAFFSLSLLVPKSNRGLRGVESVGAQARRLVYLL
jgi:hypothetical protein